MPHQKSVVTAGETHYHCGPGRAKALPSTVPGEVAEWSNVPDSKSGVGESQPWVRIPPSPPVIPRGYAKSVTPFLLPDTGALFPLCTVYVRSPRSASPWLEASAAVQIGALYRQAERRQRVSCVDSGYHKDWIGEGNMADKHPYTSGANGVVAVVNQLRKSFPAKVTADTLKKLGIAPNNETYVINILRYLDIIDGEGSKSAKAASVLSQHDESAFQAGFAGLVQAAYADLFELHGAEAWTASSDKLISFFRTTDQTSDIVGRRQASTFQTLATIGGKLDGQLPKAASAKPKKGDASTPKKQTPKAVPAKAAVSAAAVTPPQADEIRRGAAGDMALTVRVEINLPAGGDQQTYDNIFRSIRENLLNGKVS
jgi:hypothetical protein